MITLHHYGHHKAHNLFLLGDCIVTGEGTFHFPIKDGSHYNIQETEYHLSEDLGNYSPPCLFPGADTSEEAAAEFNQIDWRQESYAVREIFHGMLSDFSHIFPGGAAPAVISGVLSYLAHPEILTRFGGKPGLWIHGPKNTFKTQSVQLTIRILGVHSQPSPPATPSASTAAPLLATTSPSATSPTSIASPSTKSRMPWNAISACCVKTVPAPLLAPENPAKPRPTKAMTSLSDH